MVQMSTVIKVSDNSGVMRVKCIRVLSASKRYLIGEKISGIIARVKSFKRMKRGRKIKAYIISLAGWTKRMDGSYIKFGKTRCVIVGRRGSLRASRVRGPVMREFRKKIDVRKLGVTIRTV